MTVQTSTNTKSHTQNSDTNVDFAYDFVVMDATHMQVYVDEVLESAANYTVEDVGDAAGGNVKFNTAPPAGSLVRLTRIVPLDQLTDYRPYDPFPAETHEDALDKLTMIAQQQQEVLDRTITAQPGAGGFQFSFTAPYASNLLAFNDDGTLIVNIDSAEDKAYAWAETPEDQVVEVRGGQNRYSAYHWSVKAFNAVTLPLVNRGDIMVGDGTSSPATILPLGDNGAFLRSFKDNGGVTTGIDWDVVPEALPPTGPGDKMKILHVKASEDGFELAPQYAVSLIPATEWQDDDESDGDVSSYTVQHYQQVARRFESPDTAARAGHMVGVPLQNHSDVGYKLTLLGAIGIGEALNGTNVRLEVTPYLFWDSSGYDPAPGVPVIVEVPVTKDSKVGTPFLFDAMVPLDAGAPHDVVASFKVRRVAASADEYEGSFNVTLGQLEPI